MTTLWAARHGETDWNREGRWQGQALHAPTLNVTGRAQALGLAMQLQGRDLTAIYSSDLQQAQDTARAVAHLFRAPLYIEPRLREMKLGAWEGMLTEDLTRLHLAEIREWQINPLTTRPPGGGETAAEVLARLRTAADEIATRHPSDAVVLVSHGLALAALRCLVDSRTLAGFDRWIPEKGVPFAIDWQPGVS